MKAKDLLYILVIIGIMTFFMNDCSRGSLIEKKTVTISDTTWNTTEKDTTIYNVYEKDTTLYHFTVEEVAAPISQGRDSLRNYSGIHHIQYGQIFWQAKVSGHLEEITFESKFELPERTVYKTEIGTVTKTVEITRLPRWNLYGGIQGTVSSNFYEIGPAVNFRLGKMQYGYSYGLVNQSHSISIGVKIL